MHIIRGIAVAFSTYSKIPMPQFVWKDESGHGQEDCHAAKG